MVKVYSSEYLGAVFHLQFVSLEGNKPFWIVKNRSVNDESLIAKHRFTVRGFSWGPGWGVKVSELVTVILCFGGTGT